MTRYVNRSGVPGSPPWDTTGNGSLAAPRCPAAAQEVPYYCHTGHETVVALAADVKAPQEWDCPRCGQPAGLDKDNPPAPPPPERYHTHLQYVKERRKPKDQKQILAEAMAKAAAGGFAR